jgi:hypothetical protein
VLIRLILFCAQQISEIRRRRRLVPVQLFMATICLIKSVAQFAPKNPAQSEKKTWEPDNDDDNGRIAYSK